MKYLKEQPNDSGFESLELKANLNPEQRAYLDVLKDKMKKILGNKTKQELAKAGDLNALKNYKLILKQILQFLQTKEMFRLFDYRVNYNKFEVLKDLKGHKGVVTSVIETQDAGHIISSSGDQTIKVWDRITGKCIKTLNDHDANVRCVKETRDGKFLISASNDQTLRLWDKASWKCVKIYTGHTKAISDFIELNDKTFISVGHDSQILTWDKNSSQYISGSYRGELGSLHKIIKLNDIANIIVMATAKGTVVFDLDQADIIKHLYNSGTDTYAILESADHKYLFAGVPISQRGSQFEVQMWDKSNWKVEASFGGHTDEIRTMTQTKDGKHLITCSDDRSVRIWDIETQECIRVIELSSHDPRCIAESVNGNLIIGGRDSNIQIWGEKEL